MENNNKILKELKEVSPTLANAFLVNPYKVPSNYFNNFPAVAVERAVWSSEPVTLGNKIDIPYTCPVNYFENLPDSILQKVRENEVKLEVFEEMNEVSPILNSINKKPVFSVPDRYFETLEWNKTDKNESNVNRETPVIFLQNSKKAFQYLAAAVVIGIMALSIFLLMEKPRTFETTAKVQSNYQVKELSEQEIIEFLKSTSPAGNLVTNTGSNFKESDINYSVSEMSDKEIQQFLKENGEQEEL